MRNRQVGINGRKVEINFLPFNDRHVENFFKMRSLPKRNIDVTEIDNGIVSMNQNNNRRVFAFFLLVFSITGIMHPALGRNLDRIANRHIPRCVAAILETNKRLFDPWDHGCIAAGEIEE